MKLTDATLVLDQDNGNSLHRLPPERAREGHGVLFRCPCGTGHMLVVWFKRALGGGPGPSEGAVPLHRWEATGSGVHDLTLSPSVNAGCWHGWVQNGEVR